VLEQKTRSIGIRKVLGGQVWQITYMLIRNYLVLVLIAGMIALPIGYYLLQLQLDGFAYRININVFHMVVPLFAAMMIAFSTIIYRAHKAANANPVEALKYE
jgi:putative ABC transport system permease protein